MLLRTEKHARKDQKVDFFKVSVWCNNLPRVTSRDAQNLHQMLRILPQKLDRIQHAIINLNFM